MKNQPCTRKEICSICQHCREHCPGHIGMRRSCEPVFTHTDDRASHSQVCGFLAPPETLTDKEKAKRKGKRGTQPEAEAKAEIQVYTCVRRAA